MRHILLDSEHRRELADRLIHVLSKAVPESKVKLKGSLAEGREDAYSDIDVFWEISDRVFEDAVSSLEDILEKVGGVESFRSDPAFQNSHKRRLCFVQFAGMPLFWRVDIEIFAQSLKGDFSYDLENEAAQGKEWSPTHSALMNAIATVKALLRKQEGKAQEILNRGFVRVNLQERPGHIQDRILHLVKGIRDMDHEMARLSQRVEELHSQVFEG